MVKDMEDLRSVHNEIKEFILNIFGDIKNLEMQIKVKAGADIVTNIDLHIESQIIKFINEHYPADKILSEEFFPNSESEGRYWSIDPIDGTVNFASGLGLYCVQLALIDAGEVLYSFIYIPSRNNVFHAFKGGGAFLNGKQIETTLIEQLSNKIFLMIGLSNKSLMSEKYWQILSFADKRNMKIRILGSSGVELASMAQGHFALLYSDVKNIWDVAPGYLLASEAGCVFKNGLGEDYKLGDNEMLVYNNANLAATINLEKHINNNN